MMEEEDMSHLRDSFPDISQQEGFGGSSYCPRTVEGSAPWKGPSIREAEGASKHSDSKEFWPADSSDHSRRALQRSKMG